MGSALQPAAPSRPVRGAQVLGALHFNQTRGGALERALQALAGVQLDRRGAGGADQVDVAVVQLVDQVDEAPRRIFVQAIEGGNAAQQHGVELVRDLDVVRRTTRAFAEGGEIEPGDALAAAAHRDLAALDLDVAGLGRLPAAQFVPARGQPVIAVGRQRRAVHRRTGQRAHPVILGAFGVQLHAEALQQADGRQEALALQAVEVQVLHRRVGGGDQGHALGEQAFQQPRQQHGIADVGDEELVQHQHAQVAAPFLGDLRQRIALPLVLAQALVHAAHETVEVGRPGRSCRGRRHPRSTGP
ncbi:hypothetical protein G6F22_014783 [Rhizopus arrhizus]|nr:hypothetical protein G6F22_014783 [Rhizopus arrhizus]